MPVFMAQYFWLQSWVGETDMSKGLHTCNVWLWSVSMLLAAMISGCEQAPEETPELKDPLEPSAIIHATKPWRIAFMLKSREQENYFWKRVSNGIESAASEYGVEVEIHDHISESSTVSMQSGMMQWLTSTRPDGIILVPVDTQKLAPFVEQAVARGIPVLIYDTPLTSKQTVTQLLFDNEAGAYRLGQWLVQRLGGSGKVLILEGAQGSANAGQRSAGLLRAFAEATGIEVMERRSADWLRSEAERIVADWLDRYPEIDAIAAGNDQMALGAAQAVSMVGRSDIVITGFDGNHDAVEAIKAGRMHASVDQQPEKVAAQAVQLMVRHLETGESYPPLIHWPDAPLITDDSY